jgi:hypothetical protein
MARVRTKLMGFLGKVQFKLKDKKKKKLSWMGKPWTIINEKDENDRYILFRSIAEAKEQGATKFRPCFSRGT